MAFPDRDNGLLVKTASRKKTLLKTVAVSARRFPSPENYFSGIRWHRSFLPDNILCFHRSHPVHELTGHEGISEKSGKYDQHDRFVLILCLRQGGAIGVETNVFALKEGDALLVFPHQLHYYIDLPEHFCWFYVTFELPPEAVDAVASFHDRPRQLDEDSLALLRDFMKACRSAEKEREIDAALALRDFLIALERAPAEETRRDKDGVAAGTDANPDAALVHRIKRYIYSHLDGDLSLAAIVKQTRLSESYVRARFKDQIGISLWQFILAARVTRAAHLLKTSTNRIAVISGACGFDSQLSFTRAFKRAFAMTPSEYRKREG